MSAIEKILQIIANIFVVYGYHIENNGLVNGKAGAMLFLYKYARYSGNEHYQSYADDMLDGMMRIAPSLSIDFENGLAGVGWTVGRLLDDDLLEGEPNAVLRSVDNVVFNRVECDPSVSVLGQAVYLVERLKHGTSSFSLENRVREVLTFILNGMETYKGTFSLYHVNSLLYFLASVCKLVGLSQDLCRIVRLMPPLLERIRKERMYDITDLVVHRQIVDVLKGNVSEIVNFSESLQRWPNFEISFDVSQFIRVAWQQLLYFDHVTIPFPANNAICHFVDEKLQSIQMTGFVVNGGLAGLGLSLLDRAVCKG